MRLRVVSVGRDRSGLFQPAVDTYAGRLRRYLPFELVELPASRVREPVRARDEEATRSSPRWARTAAWWPSTSEASACRARPSPSG